MGPGLGRGRGAQDVCACCRVSVLPGQCAPGAFQIRRAPLQRGHTGRSAASRQVGELQALLVLLHQSLVPHWKHPTLTPDGDEGRRQVPPLPLQLSLVGTGEAVSPLRPLGPRRQAITDSRSESSLTQAPESALASEETGQSPLGAVLAAAADTLASVCPSL